MLDAVHQPFRHFILTRFNIMTEFAPPAQRLDEDWIRARMEPFRQYCIPSVSSQTREVTWFVFFDAESPQWLKGEVASYPAINPIYLSNTGTSQAMASALVETGKVDRPYLITTRVDSDDALARTFSATVQSAFEHQDREWIELPVGLQVYRGGVYTRVWRSNPFLSLVERVDPNPALATAFSMNHAKVLRTQRTRSLWRSPQWLQTLHDANNESILAGGVVPRLSSKPRAFACDWEPQPADPFRRRAGFAVKTGALRGVRKTRAVLGR